MGPLKLFILWQIGTSNTLMDSRASDYMEGQNLPFFLMDVRVTQKPKGMWQPLPSPVGRNVCLHQMLGHNG